MYDSKVILNYARSSYASKSTGGINFNTNWKEIFKRSVIAMGKGIWFFLSRILYPAFLYVGKFIFFTAIPAMWTFLRNYVFPALHKLYMKLPRRRTVTAATLAIVGLGIAIWVIQPFQTDPDPFGNAKPIKLPAQEGKWAKNLVSSDWNMQKDTTKEILQQLGLTVLDENALPAEQDTLFVIPPELTLLAMDSGQKPTTGRINLGELALMMNEFDFPFIEGQDPVTLLRSGVQQWVQSALDDPKQPGAEAPLFLYAMAAQQQPAIDLSSDHWMAGEYYLTYLELLVFISAFYQALPEEQIRETASLSSLFFKTAHAAEAGACTRFKDYVSSLGEQYGAQDGAAFGNFLIQQLASHLTGWGLDQLGKVGDFAKKVMVPISIILKIQKLAMLYGALDISLTADQGSVHKPGQGEAGEEVKFIATIGVDKEKYEEYLEQWNSSPAARNIKDCLAFFGLPMPTDMGDIAGEVEKWSVAWDLYGNHATWGTEKNEFSFPAQRKMKLKRTSETHGEATFIVDMKHEPGRHEGDEVTDFMVGSATLHTDQPPVIDKFIDAGKAGVTAAKSDQGWGLLEVLGLGNAAVEVVAGWLQRIIDPVTYYNVAVAEHKHRFADYTYAGTISGVQFRHVQDTAIGYIGFTPIKNNKSTVESTIFYGKFETSTSSYTPGHNIARYGLKGNSNIEGSYAYGQSGNTELSCIGGQVNVTISVDRSGHNSSSMERDMSMTIHEVDGKHIVKLNMHSPSIYIPIEGQTIRTDSASGCTHVESSNSVEKYESWVNNGMSMLSEEFTVDEAYPEVISGRKEIEEDDGSTTSWSWNFIRIDPSREPTYIDAVGG